MASFFVWGGGGGGGRGAGKTQARRLRLNSGSGFRVYRVFRVYLSRRDTTLDFRGLKPPPASNLHGKREKGVAVISVKDCWYKREHPNPKP